MNEYTRAQAEAAQELESFFNRVFESLPEQSNPEPETCQGFTAGYLAGINALSGHLLEVLFDD